MACGMGRLHGHTQSRSCSTVYPQRGFDNGKITDTVRRWAFSAPLERTLASLKLRAHSEDGRHNGFLNDDLEGARVLW